ncbi:MAG: DUF86 domain-containing protein [Candidatus Atribacteria bacterium]|nr:DUF86 domain-containing protein [Candidatus Atribacteria bacterium]
MQKALSILKEFQKEKKEKIIGDLKVLGSVKYYFIVVMEGCIDVCHHILSHEQWGAPESYSDGFVLLGEKKIIPTQLAQDLTNMAKFRNYWFIFTGKSMMKDSTKYCNLIFKILTI